MCLYVHTHTYICTIIKWVWRKAGPLHFHIFPYVRNRNETVRNHLCHLQKLDQLDFKSFWQTEQPLTLWFSHQHFPFLPKSVCSKNILLGHTFSLHTTKPSPSYAALKWLNLVPEQKTMLARLNYSFSVFTLLCTGKRVCSCGVD